MEIDVVGHPAVGRSSDAAYIAVMAELINLRRARKQKARANAEAEAKAKRSAHGLTKAERKRAKAESDAASRKLDGHKRDDT